MPLDGTKVGGTLSSTYSTLLDLGTAVFPTNLSRGAAFDNGTGAGQVDRIFTDTRTLTASSTETLDLAGVLTDAFGNVLTFARIKAILVAASAANTNNVIVGANVASSWATFLGPTGASGGTITLQPGGFFVAGCGSADATGWVVTAATGDLIKVANSAAGTSVSYDIAVVGCSV